MIKPADIYSSFSGKTQDDRILPALSPDTFLVDDRDTADFLAFTAKLARAFTYFNLENKNEGSWHQILIEDPVVMLAYISKTDHSQEFHRYLDYRDGIFHTLNFGTKRLFAQQFFSIGFHLVLRINRWYKLSNKSLTHHPFRDYLYNIIVEEGRLVLEKYYRIYFDLTKADCGFKNEVISKLEDLDRVWMFNSFPCSDKTCDPDITPEEFNRSIAKGVNVGQELFHLQEKILHAAKDFFEETLTQNDTSPHIGLLLTFLNLFKIQQENLNELTKSHLDFYFNDVLGFGPLPPFPDTSHIHFYKGNVIFDLPEQTSISAGNNEDGEEIVFSTSNHLKVTKGAVGKYSTLTFEYDKDTDAFNGLYSGIVKKFDQLALQSWPVLGASSSIDPNYVVKEEVQNFGFAISSPDLILSSGERAIEITFYKTNTTASADTVSETTPTNTSSSENPFLDFQLTSPKGWALIDSHCSFIGTDKISFKLKLVNTDPAIVAYDSKIHDPGFDTIWPVCKITIAKGIAKSNFELLSDFTFEKFTIDTNVKDNENLIVQNERGKASSKSPFFPFGNPPLPGANLFIGGQEFFIKELTKLDLNLIWDHLPDDFTAYYQAYPSQYANDVFKASMSYFNVKAQAWELLMSNQENQVSLFTADQSCFKNISANETDTEDMSDGTSSTSDKKNNNNDAVVDSVPHPLLIERNINFTPPDQAAQPNLPVVTAFDQDVKNAFFKFTFTEPGQGFGDAEYPKLLSEITLSNGQAIIWNAKVKEANIPNFKYLEKLYKSKSEVEALQVQFKGAVGQIELICFMITDLVDEVCSILADCIPEEEKQKLAVEELKTGIGNIQLSLEKILNDIKQFKSSAFEIITNIPQPPSKSPKCSASGGGGSWIKSAIGLVLGGLALSPAKRVAGKAGLKVVDELKKILPDAIKKIGKAKSGTKKSLIGRLFSSNKSSDSPDDAKTFSEVENRINGLLKDIKSQEEALSNLKDSILGQSGNVSQPGTPVAGSTPSPITCDALNDAKKKAVTALYDFQTDLFHFNALFNAFIKIIEGLIEAQNCDYIPLQPLPNKPFVPKIKSLSIDYSSTGGWELTTADNEGQTIPFQLYHLTPYGVQQVEIDNSAVSIFPDLKDEGYAFIGFEKLNPEESITVLFNITSQVKSNIAEVSETVSFDYLTENGWEKLTLDADDTYGLEQTGVIKFIVPEEMTDQSTSMPKNYFWIRIKKAPEESTNQTSDTDTLTLMTNFVGAQAVKIQRVVESQTNVTPLAAGTITSTLNSNISVKNIIQPHASFGGGSKETDTALYQRAAYRLNNKNRAVRPADLENLILQRFDSLYAATAVPMRYYHPYTSHVLRVVLSALTSTNDKHPYRPLVDPNLMRVILDFSQQYCPSSMSLEIINPDFYTITVDASVSFENANEKGSLEKQLNTDLINYLSPWLKDNPVKPYPENLKNLASLRTFILSRTYVKELNELSFTYQKENDENGKNYGQRKFESIIRPWYLVVPALIHNINDSKNKNSMSMNIKNKKPVEVQHTV